MTGRGLAETIAVLRDAGARFALLHGSRAAGTHRPDSDVDVAAWWPSAPPASFEVLLPPGVDLLVLNTAPLELAGRVAQHGTVLFDDDPPARIHWAAMTRKIYADERPRLERSHREFAEGAVDEVRVLRLLRSITDDLAVLRAESTADTTRRGDPLWLRGRYTFVTAVEACIDVAHHVCATQGWGPPRDNGDALRLLGAHAVLTEDLAARMRRAAGFRDVLVHDYAAVDDDVVLARLADPDDLRQFVAAVTGWLPSAP